MPPAPVAAWDAVEGGVGEAEGDPVGGHAAAAAAAAAACVVSLERVGLGGRKMGVGESEGRVVKAAVLLLLLREPAALG
eukprot:1159228-Pelagomonas_calceolata.AAC.8